ncbi:MAG: hypothetical protein ALECFALPRED_009180 [Alectoria fallacina]|uniref:Uncharacterized protein n=1 Tax=Alectoria fallacina TaxID=1903189 RepID=A0A8H3PIG9_9LECA|nr:MAG: hypothetical protein ALECFALPRED_009180 [Alectoria fallacina]
MSYIQDIFKWLAKQRGREEAGNQSPTRLYFQQSHPSLPHIPANAMDEGVDIRPHHTHLPPGQRSDIRKRRVNAQATKRSQRSSKDSLGSQRFKGGKARRGRLSEEKFSGTVQPKKRANSARVMGRGTPDVWRCWSYLKQDFEPGQGGPSRKGYGAAGGDT